jgi:ADP-heptose:LPS heptosyltransferase
METRKNILLIRFKSIGDVLLTLPAVHAVRENFPAARITFLTVRENAPLLRGFRDVDEVISLDRTALKNPLRAAPEFFRLLRRLRAGKFSIVVDFQGYGETAWLMGQRLWQGPRVGIHQRLLARQPPPHRRLEPVAAGTMRFARRPHPQ